MRKQERRKGRNREEKGMEDKKRDDGMKRKNGMVNLFILKVLLTITHAVRNITHFIT